MNNKYDHLEIECDEAINLSQVTALTLHLQNVTALLKDCAEFVPSDLRRKIEITVGE